MSNFLILQNTDLQYKNEMIPVIVVSSSVIFHLANKVIKSIVFHVQQWFLPPIDG